MLARVLLTAKQMPSHDQNRKKSISLFLSVLTGKDDFAVFVHFEEKR
tara:strand:- start:974 stop:1114 length:141 start_codon:yes stop_codon:yes gene_type:complete